MSERCEECVQLRLERDQAISVQEGLAKQLLLEVEGHARTQHWLDTFQGSLNDATWMAVAVVVAGEAVAVTGLIAAIYTWREWLAVDQAWAQANSAQRELAETFDATMRMERTEHDRIVVRARAVIMQWDFGLITPAQALALLRHRDILGK